MPGLLPDAVVSREIERLPRAARRMLGNASPADVLRDPNTRTSFRWRLAFTQSVRERVAVVDQMVWPHGSRSVSAAVRRLIGRR